MPNETGTGVSQNQLQHWLRGLGELTMTKIDQRVKAVGRGSHGSYF